jgi:hypothetical protein
MRANVIILAVLAGLGLSSFGAVSAEAKNLSCITEISPNERRLLRDCEPTPDEEEIVYVIEVMDPPPTPSSTLWMKHGEGGKGRGGDRGRDAPGGGNGGGNSGGNGRGANSAAN